ncbi:uncharacterized protein [Dermacentor albipictus]|uniref:uncharacterized protein isoform X2 n=1 Tax=Dermacentor albipictus TaxID=60249 RepID=UPI0038FD3CC5
MCFADRDGFGFPTLQEDMEDGQPLTASTTGWRFTSSRTAAGGRCDAAPMHHFGKAFLWQDGHDCEYAACSPSQFTQWRVFTQASEVCSWALHFAQCDPTYQHGVGR